MMIRNAAYARGGLIGNPSDGYYGKTIALTFTNFRADVVLYETPDLEILPNRRDHSRFNGIGELARDVNSFGYYGGIRLIKASVKKFHDYAIKHGHPLHNRNFTLHYTSDIPHQVGLAGSSAIITACIRCLMEFYDVTIPHPQLANLILAVETQELGISAGLQDRVAQVYGALVYMDFNQQTMQERGHGIYEPLDPANLPPLYIAYRRDLSEGSEIVHNTLRQRFNRKDPEVLDAMAFWADLTEQARTCLLAGQVHKLGPLLNANFDRRASLYDVGEGNRRMVEAARQTGASAKFTGSGGAIIGTYEDDTMLEKLTRNLNQIHCDILIPTISPPIPPSPHGCAFLPSNELIIS
jgi:glucuronokinase